MISRGWTQEELADEIPAGQSSVSRWLGGQAEPTGRKLERIQQLAMESGVIDREPRPSNRAPLMGRVGAGAKIEVEFEQAPPEGYDSVELPLAYPDAIIAFEVAGDSMFPAYDPGDIIVCRRDQVRSTDHFIGQKAVVRISTGERYLKRIARGPRRGTFNLESWNARTIEDVVIEWVGEIVGTVPAGAYRGIKRQRGGDAAAQRAASANGQQRS